MTVLDKEFQIIRGYIVVVSGSYETAVCLFFSVIDVTAYIYFTCFAPFIYIMFLRTFFAYVNLCLLFRSFRFC